MPSDRCTLTVTLPWWSKHFLRTAALFAATFGLQPDTEKIARTLMRHAKTTLTKNPG